jgi:hypothetical protein
LCSVFNEFAQVGHCILMNLQVIGEMINDAVLLAHSAMMCAG